MVASAIYHIQGGTIYIAWVIIIYILMKGDRYNTGALEYLTEIYNLS